MKNNGISRLIVTIIIVKTIQSITGFSYHVFSESFDIIRLVMDIAIWAIVYFPVSWVFDRVYKNHKDADELN